MSLGEVRGLNLAEARCLLAAAERQERDQARLALFVARAAQAGADGYAEAWDLLGKGA